MRVLWLSKLAVSTAGVRWAVHDPAEGNAGLAAPTRTAGIIPALHSCIRESGFVYGFNRRWRLGAIFDGFYGFRSGWFQSTDIVAAIVDGGFHRDQRFRPQEPGRSPIALHSKIK
jgi:hypothetical protein